MKLLAIGDSFTYGEELLDRNNCWPSLVGKKLNFDVKNLGKPGGSNWRLVRKLLSTNLEDCDLVLIGWSHYDRFEIADELGVWDIWPGGKRTKYCEEASWRKKITHYVGRHHNDEYLYQMYFIYVILVQNWLAQKNNIPFLMMDAFGNHEEPLRFAPQFKSFFDQVDVNTFIGWPNESMLEWTKNVEFGIGGHFLDEGHQIVADIIYNNLIRLYPNLINI